MQKNGEVSFVSFFCVTPIICKRNFIQHSAVNGLVCILLYSSHLSSFSLHLCALNLFYIYVNIYSQVQCFLFSFPVFHSDIFYCLLNFSFFSYMGHFVMIEWTLDYKGTGF